MATLISLLFVVLSLIGIADAGYITYERLTNQVPPCAPGFNCEAVLTSPWANIGNIPISALGLIFYITMFLLAVVHYLQLDISPVFKKAAQQLKLSELHPLYFITVLDLLFLASIFGALFTAYLVFLMAFVINAWCSFCLISAFTSLSLFGLASFYVGKVQNPSLIFSKWLINGMVKFKYTRILKPIFFQFDPEVVHNTMTKFGSLLGGLPLTKMFPTAFFSFTHPINTVKKNGISFPNPVGLAAGFDYDGDLTQTLPSVGFGFHTIGTVTLHPYEGNVPPRLGRLPRSRSLLVNKGFKSIGAAALIKKLSSMQFEIPTGISIGSTNKEFKSSNEQIADIIGCFQLFEKSALKHAYYELNISCPNTKGGQPFTTPERLKKLVAALKVLKIKRPVYVKMPIDMSDAETLALVAVIDTFKLAGMIFGNLTKDKNNPAVHKDDAKIWKAKIGNLSGKPTWDRSNHLLALVRKKYGQRFTLIGTGGIFSGEDALYKLNQGADLVQLITGMIYQGPQLIGEINNYLARHQLLNPSTKQVRSSGRN